MKLRPRISRKTGRKGWWIRYSDPISGERFVKTFWISERRLAEKARENFLDSLNARAEGLPDNSGWKLPYARLVKKFLNGFNFETRARRRALRLALKRNHLRIACGADLAHRGKLTAACKKFRRKLSLLVKINWKLRRGAVKGDRRARLLRLQEKLIRRLNVSAKVKRPDEYIIKYVQEPLKQLATWAAGEDLFPYDPLSAWKKIKRTTARADEASSCRMRCVQFSMRAMS